MSHSVLESTEDIQAFVRAHPRIHVMGKGSKTALHGLARDSAVAGLTKLKGITEYRPEEYTLTVRAGTPVHKIQAELHKHGQYLPFDPLYPAYATIGGTVASNLSGSRRFRYGGLRDFILGADVVDGLGRAFGVGGKVVKNAAGFDLSKFRYSAGGNVAWVAIDDIDRLDAVLRQYALSGLCIRGAVDSPLIGKTIENVLAARVKQVLDPENKFV